MVKSDWYEPLALDRANDETIRSCFVSTLLGSNRDAAFFVDWTKVRRNIDAYRTPLRLLEGVRGHQNPSARLTEILLESPSVAPLLPMIIAWRNETWSVLEIDSKGGLRTSDFDFSGTKRYSPAEAELVVEFCKASGVLRVLSETDDLAAYLFGVEVGMDTNARKNRSGTFMEQQVKPHVARACSLHPNWRMFEHRKYSAIQKAGVPVPQGLLSRIFDYAVVGPERRVSIEVNFYDKEGSKPQEIVDSYLRRAEELRSSGWEFIWITDGPGWRGDTAQLKKAFAGMAAVLNIEFCRRGVLERILGSGVPEALGEYSRRGPGRDLGASQATLNKF